MGPFLKAGSVSYPLYYTLYIVPCLENKDSSMYFSNKETMFTFKLDHPALYVSNVIYGMNKAYPIRNIQLKCEKLKGYFF